MEGYWLLTGIRKDSYAVADPVRGEERKAVRTRPIAPRFVVGAGVKEPKPLGYRAGQATICQCFERARFT